MYGIWGCVAEPGIVKRFLQSGKERAVTYRGDSVVLVAIEMEEKA